MTTLLKSIKRLITKIDEQGLLTNGTQAPPGTSRQPARLRPKQPQTPSPIVVKRDTRTYLEKQGWKLDTSSYPSTWHGYYRTRAGSWKGKITASTPPRFSIYKPPEALTTKHSHKLCFHLRPDGWCDVHFRIVPGDLSSGILKLEKILNEASVIQQKSS